jgi:predicted transcriptional regulator
MSNTTMKISKGTKKKLSEQRNYPKEALEDVVLRLLKFSEQDDELTPQDIKDIEEGLADIKAGRVVTTEQLRQNLGLS